MFFVTKFAALFKHWYIYLYLLLGIGFFAYFWANSTFYDESGNFQVTHVSLWGDWAVHFTMGSAMGYRKLFLESSPLLIDAQFNYPFVANMISAVLIRLGVSFVMSFVMPSLLFCIALVFMLPILYWRAFGRNKVIAILASLIFLLNGGTGFIQYIEDIRDSQTPWQTALNPPVEYTHLSETQQIHWISVVNSQIIPQRALTIGVPVSLLSLFLVYGSWFGTAQKKKLLLSRNAAVAAVLYGLLPIIHAHSFIAMTGILGCWAVAKLVRSYYQEITLKQTLLPLAQFFALSALLAIPLLLNFVVSNAGSDGFMKWYPGWYQKETPELSIITFWFRNWSLTPVLALVGYFYGIKKSLKTERLQFAILFLPFFVLFVLANLFLFQPHAWDNTKLFLWVSVGFSGLAAYSIYSLYTATRKSSFPLSIRIAGALTAILLFVSITITGTIDNWRILRFQLHTYQMYSAEELAVAEWVKANTPVDAVWLTGDQHNHWVYNLTGRQTLLVFRGWLWTHGYNYSQAEADLSMMFQNPSQYDLFEKYNIQYAVIGPNERDVWKANLTGYMNTHELIWELDNQMIFKLRPRPKLSAD